MNRRYPPALGSIVGCLILGAMLAGCANDPPMPDDKVVFVDPGTPAPEPGILLPDSDPVRWVSRRLSLPLGQSTQDAWAFVDETVLNDLSRAVWNGNGLRVGVMPASRGRALSQALGDPRDRRDTQILSYGFPEDVRESPTLRAEFFADLTLPPRPVTMEFFTRGQLRMLMASRPLGNGSTRVTLTPQHYLRKTTLLPRSPQERKLDGRVFDELTVEITVGRSDILLLGFYQKPPLTPEEGEPQPEEAAAAEDKPLEPLPDPGDPESLPQGEDPETDEPINIDNQEVEVKLEVEAEETAEEPPPLNLGRGLFTTGVDDDDLQLLFLFRPLP